MMHCQRVQRLIGVYRELDRAEARMVDAHLRDCSSCRAAWGDEQRVRRYLASIPVLEVPRHLQPQLLAIPATVAATPSLLALLLRLLGAIVLVLGLGSSAGDRPVDPRVIEPAPAASDPPAGAPLTALDNVGLDLSDSPRLAAGPNPMPAPVSRDGLSALQTPEPTPSLGEPTSGAASARADRDEDEPRRGRVVVTLPARSSNMGPGDGNIPAIQTAPADAGSPTQAPAPSTAPSCAALTILLYADVGVEGTTVDDCVNCDGQLGPADRSAWLESNHMLPDGLRLTIRDARTGAPLFDERIAANGQALISVSLNAADHPWICGRDRIDLRLGMPLNAYEEGWQACPHGPGHQRELWLGESRSTAFGLTRACPTQPEPQPPAPEPSDEPRDPAPTEQPPPEPSASPVAPQPVRTQTRPPAPSPTPIPTQAAEEPGPTTPDPDPGPGSGNAPDPEPGPPSGAPTATPPVGGDPPPPPPDPPTPKPEPTTPGPVPPPPTDL